MNGTRCASYSCNAIARRFRGVARATRNRSCKTGDRGLGQGLRSRVPTCLISSMPISSSDGWIAARKRALAWASCLQRMFASPSRSIRPFFAGMFALAPCNVSVLLRHSLLLVSSTVYMTQPGKKKGVDDPKYMEHNVPNGTHLSKPHLLARLLSFSFCHSTRACSGMPAQLASMELVTSR